MAVLDPLVVAATVPLVAVAELPDKTMFATLLLSTRGRPAAVWAGAAAAFTVHVALAATVGAALLHVLPHRAVDAVAAGLFAAGAGLVVAELWRDRRGDPTDADRPLVEREMLRHRQAAVAAFAVIFVAEWGDLTQLLVANLAARSHSPLSVALGALVGLWAVAALAVVGGRGVLRVVPVSAVRLVMAAALVALCAASAAAAA